MSNEVVSWSERLAADAKEVATLFKPSVGRIGLKAGVMTYEGNPVAGNAINVVVLASAFENAFYKGRYDPNQLSNPDCFALSLTGEGMVPDKIVAQPISPVCDGCAYIEWGSDPNGGRGKACKEVVRLALLPVGNASDAEAISKSELATMRVSVTNVKQWGNYVQKLSAMSGRPPWSVITEIKVVPDAKTQFKILFEMKALVTEDAILTALNQRIAMGQAVVMTAYDSTGVQAQEDNSPAVTSKKKKY